MIEDGEVMDFTKKFLSYWFFLIIAVLAVYIGISNIDYIYVRIPQVGEFKTRAAFAFLAWFVAGAGVTAIWFGMDAIKKSLRIRTLQHKVRQLQIEAGDVRLVKSSHSRGVDGNEKLKMNEVSATSND